jgi:hypothetical protein
MIKQYRDLLRVVVADVFHAQSGGSNSHLGDFDLSAHLDRYRDQRLVPITAPIREAEPATYTCGVCGFVMNEVGECPRCRLAVEEVLSGPDSGNDGPDILDQVRELLDGADGDDAPSADD